MAAPRRPVAEQQAGAQTRDALALAVQEFERQQAEQAAMALQQARAARAPVVASSGGTMAAAQGAGADRQARIQTERARIAALSPEERQREYEAYLLRKQQQQQQQALDSQYLMQRDAVRPDPIMGPENNVERWMPQASQRGAGASRVQGAKVRV